MDKQHPNPEEQTGGYGTPTVEQEMGGRTQEAGEAEPQEAQPPEEESKGDATGLPDDEEPKDEGEKRFDGG